jgi:2-polyprenyl-3-methyl-5-hydroxy-6-metoxy-1,4-benzoquinol methylase
MHITPDQNQESPLQAARQDWDRAAPSFDHEPDHGLRDPLVLETWTRLLKTWLLSTCGTILDIGCGTGSLSVVLAGLGHIVTGIDISPAMIALAQAKAAAHGYPITFQVMDAAFPQFSRHSFDVLVCRHLLWALPEPKQALQRWAELLKPKGRLFMIEGHWRTGAGLHANEIFEMLPSSFRHISTQDLSADPNYWGGPVTDERYAIIADLDQ